MINDIRRYMVFIWILFAFMLFIVLTVITTSCSPMSDLNKLLGLEDDNILEEIVECGIDECFDVDIDLTGDSKE